MTDGPCEMCFPGATVYGEVLPGFWLIRQHNGVSSEDVGLRIVGSCRDDVLLRFDRNVEPTPCPSEEDDDATDEWVDAVADADLSTHPCHGYRLVKSWIDNVDDKPDADGMPVFDQWLWDRCGRLLEEKK